MPKLEVRVSRERLERWQTAAAGSGSLSAWVRAVLDRAAAPRPVEDAAARRRERERPARSREVEAHLAAQVREAERSERTAKVTRPPARTEAERLAARLAGIDRQEFGTRVEPSPAPDQPAAAAAVEEPAEELYRVGRCRHHPAARPRRFDLGRCAWGCRLP